MTFMSVHEPFELNMQANSATQNILFDQNIVVVTKSFSLVNAYFQHFRVSLLCKYIFRRLFSISVHSKKRTTEVDKEYWRFIIYIHLVFLRKASGT